jgi:hypothetical protein
LAFRSTQVPLLQVPLVPQKPFSLVGSCRHTPPFAQSIVPVVHWLVAAQLPGVQLLAYWQVKLPVQDATLPVMDGQSVAVQHCPQVPLQLRWPLGQHFPALQVPVVHVLPVQQVWPLPPQPAHWLFVH